MRNLFNLLYFLIILDVRSFPSCAPGKTQHHLHVPLKSVAITAPHVESERWIPGLTVAQKSEGILYFEIIKRMNSW